ncbi:MAG TPA: hypothetical protein VIG25_09690 [Pyrinomonadaceae bacterium]|jgi:hypothetical protein
MPSKATNRVAVIKEVSGLAHNPDKPGFVRPYRSVPYLRVLLSSSLDPARVLISLIAITLFAHATQAQNGSGNLQNILHEKAVFTQTDLAELQQGAPVVTLLPTNHKQEVAVYGVVRVQAPAEVFLQSFRDTMATRSNPAILESGRFSDLPVLQDLNTLTLESQDIEDLKRCAIGNCEVKLSGKMIGQFQKTIDWQSSEYENQATRLYKLMLLDYVRDYLEQGDQALIQYNDKSKTVSLLEGQRALLDSFPAFFHQSMQNGNSSLTHQFRVVENAIVWSKIKFGLKPVLAINHIVMFKNEHELGPQVLILSKQIYANHYFDASLALTGLARNPAEDQGYYLFYENHSLADGLQGLFTNIKRKLVEHQAKDGLKDVLRGTKARLDSLSLNQNKSVQPPEVSSSWTQLRIRSKQLLVLLFCITALAMIAFAGYQRKANIPPGTHAS